MRLRVMLVVLLMLAAIYAVVRALDLDIDRLLGYLASSALLVLSSALTGLLIVAVLKFFQR